MSIKIFQEAVATASAEPVRVAKVFDGPGRGRKQCSSCGIYIGVRSKTCPQCDHSFLRKKKTRSAGMEPGAKTIRKATRKRRTKPKVKNEVVVRADETPPTNVFIVLAPSGKCPVPLEAEDADSVKAWALKLREVGLAKGDFYTPEAIKYYAREFYPAYEDKYATICELIDAGLSVEE